MLKCSIRLGLVASIVLISSSSLTCAAEPFAPVTVTDADGSYYLKNQFVTARIEKQTGDVLSLSYKGLELLGNGPGRTNGYFSLPGTTMTFGSKHVASIKLDPTTTNGDRATVAVQFTYDKGESTVPADVEMVYSLGRNDSGLYLMENWNHKPEYPLVTFPVGRFAAKLNPAIFDYLATDNDRHRIMPTAADWGAGVAQNMKEARLLTTGQYKGQVEHKYDYAAVQFENPAYGWASTTKHVGLWLVTPSNEYMSGGSTKVELNAHLDGNESGYPTLLNVWKGPHYGGTVINIPKGESWIKAVGPFMLYCNSADTGDQMFAEARAHAALEAKAWPYSWVNEPTYYAPKDARSTVAGTIKLNDPITSQSQISHLLVGLSAPEWKANGRTVDWQQDGKFYQFWTHGDDSGRFSIPNVLPGNYVLHAIANGVLGEFAQANIHVEQGKPLDLGTLEWKPVRDGRQLWEIGIPDRTSGEFFNGDAYWHWGIYNKYPKDFPNDVHYVIGKSDFHKDWNIMQVPRGTNNTGRSFGPVTTWTVSFNLDAPPHGKATLRLGIAGAEVRALTININGKLAGTLTGFPNTMVIHRDSDRGYWFERDVAFDASMMKGGDNTLALIIPAGGVTSGIQYDYLRLELDESAAAPAPPGPVAIPAAPRNAPPAAGEGD